MDWESAAKKYIASSNPILELNAGRIAFGIAPRAWDEVIHELIVLELKGQPVTFGEWIPKSLAGSSDFRVHIAGFGYYDGYLAGAPGAQNRREFTIAERLVIEEMIRSLFASPAPQASHRIFSLRNGRFSGDASFSPGWIREKQAAGQRKRWWRKE